MEVDDFEEDGDETQMVGSSAGGEVDFVSSTHTMASRGTKASRVTRVSRGTRTSKGKGGEEVQRKRTVGEKMGFLDSGALTQLATECGVDDMMLGSYTMNADLWNDAYRHQSLVLSNKDVAYRLPVQKPSTVMAPKMPLSSQNKRQAVLDRTRFKLKQAAKRRKNDYMPNSDHMETEND